MKFDIEQVRDASTPEEMRAEIFRLSHYDSMVRNCRDAANYRGSSAEDYYTMLAYYALKDRQKFMGMVLDQAMIDPAPQMQQAKEPA